MTMDSARKGLPQRVEGALAEFSEPSRDVLRNAVREEAVIGPDALAELLRLGGGSTESLMISLMPVAAAYSVHPVSGFAVGAVAHCELEGGRSALHLGCNLESAGLSLVETVHAEQSTVAAAWSGGATSVISLAVTAAPCGPCRQFLSEVSTERLPAILLGTVATDYDELGLDELLPRKFGPADLDRSEGLLDGQGSATRAVRLRTAVADPVVTAALEAARSSYAPYSGNLAGVALELAGGRTLAGRYIENAAFNPSLSPMHVALLLAHLWSPVDASVTIERAVLAELPAASSQLATAERLIHAWAPGIELERQELVRG